MLRRKIFILVLIFAFILQSGAIFGPAKSVLAVTSKHLQGKVIGIDAGHQSRANYFLEQIAPDSNIKKAKVSSGTVGVRSRVPEYKINLSVALKLETLLKKEGATVIMTRTTNNVNISNKDRALMMNRAEADLVVRIHCDGNTNSSVYGAHVLTPNNPVNIDIHKKSYLLAKCILNEFIEATGARSRGISKRTDQTGFNWSKVPVVTIEMGFMTNKTEDILLNSDSYQNKCALGLLNGIIKYLESQ